MFVGKKQYVGNTVSVRQLGSDMYFDPSLLLFQYRQSIQ